MAAGLLDQQVVNVTHGFKLTPYTLLPTAEVKPSRDDFEDTGQVMIADQFECVVDPLGHTRNRRPRRPPSRERLGRRECMTGSNPVAAGRRIGWQNLGDGDPPHFHAVDHDWYGFSWLVRDAHR